MVRVKNIIKIITIIVVIITFGSIFVHLSKIIDPRDNSMAFLYGHFGLIAMVLILNLLPDRVVKLNKIKEMVEYNEFQGIYQELLTRHKKELDKYRNQIIIKRIIQFVLAGVFVLIYLSIELGWIVYLDEDLALATPNIAVVAVVLLLISFFVNTKAETMYRKTYKEKVIGSLIEQLGNNLSYSEISTKQPNVLNAYAKAGFDISKYNRSEVDDYITGQLEEGLNVSMVDLNLTRVVGSGKNRREVKVFNGMFVDITANKNVDATIKILANRNKKHSKIDLMDKNCEKIEMDSQAFEKHYNVYTDNKIITMQILTSEIMEMLTQFRNNFGVDQEIVITKNHIYLRFHTGSLFEAKVFGGSINRKDLLSYYGVLKMAILVSKKINEIIVNSEI